MTTVQMESLADAYAKARNLPPALVRAIVWQESRWNPSATGGLAEVGLMQLLPTTARGLGFEGSFGDRHRLTGLYDPRTNLDYGTRYLKWAYDYANQFGWGIDSAISIYNGGPSRVAQGDGKRVESAGNQPRRSLPFINQPYVDSVVRKMQEYERSARDTNLGTPLVASMVMGLLTSFWR